MKTNKAKLYSVWYCESKNGGLSCADYKERKIKDKRMLKAQCVHAACCDLGTICFLKQFCKN